MSTIRTKVSQTQQHAETRCLFCHDDFIDEQQIPCQCGALYHLDCFDTYGCGTIGCSGTIATKNQLSGLVETDVRLTPFGFVSFIWLLGASIIALLTTFCYAFSQSILALPFLLVGSALSYILAFSFRYKAHETQREKNKS